jgi:recombinational DNA repair protein (RecF pathway)
LYLLGQELKDQALIKSVFELRSATMSGYMPELSGCVYCNAPISELMYLDVMGGRLICTDCLAKRNKRRAPAHTDYDDIIESGILCPVSPSTLAALRYIVGAPDNKAFSFALKDSADSAELTKTTETYILNHLGRSFESLDFYNTVK